MRTFQDKRLISRKSFPGRDYLLTVAAVALCTAVSIVAHPLSQEAPFIFFVPAVFFSLWIGGLRAALLSSVLSALAVDYFLLPPVHSFMLAPRDLLKEIFFVAMMGVVAWFYDRQRNLYDASLRLQNELLEAAAESILITDAEHHVIYWNRGAEHLYGWTQDELAGKLPESLLETQYPTTREEIDRILREKGHWHGRLVRRSRDGHTVVTQSSWALDERTRYILQTDLDVTEASHAQAELRRVNRALNSLSRVRQVVMHSSNEEELLQCAIEVIAQEGGYPLAWIGFPNDDAERTVTIGPSAGVAREVLSEISLTWADEPKGWGPCGTALRTGKACIVPDFHHDPNCAPWQNVGAFTNLLSATALPIIVEGKTIAGLTLYSNDENSFAGREFELVSELAADLAYGLTSMRARKQAEEERKSRIELEEQFRQAQKMEAIGRLAGGISHDFNNLLMVIMAQTELLSLQVSGSALARTESVMKSAQRAADLTRQLLAFSRKQIVQPKVLSLNPILEDTARMLSHLVGEDIEIATALSRNPWLVKVDRSQFEQVIMNLVVNARDAMPNGGRLTLETANVEITTEYKASHPLVVPGKYVMLAVSDTGIGMDEETKARMFEPFFTTKEPGKGTGLGLPMVYGIVKQANGFLWCYSELGRGTCFKIYLPAAEANQPADEIATVSSTALSKKHATILLVEDERSLSEVISEFLRSDGYRVIVAESHEEAMERVTEYGDAIDLLLTDVILRGQNGKQLANTIRSRGNRFKVIYMSGYTPNAIVHHGVLDDATMFLQKPFSRAALLAKIHEALSE